MEYIQPIVRDLVIPIEQYPHLNENQTLDEAIYSFVEFRAGQKERLHYAMLFVVDNQNHLTGRLSLMDMMRGIAPGVFDGVRVADFKGKKGEYASLSLLYEESIFVEFGKNRLKPVKQLVRAIDFTISADTPMLKALVMMSGRGDMDVPVTEDGSIIGVIRLEEIFMAMCTAYCRLPFTGGGQNE